MKQSTENFSLKRRFTFFFILFIVAIYTGVLVTSYRQIMGLTETISAELGMPIIKEALRIIDGDSFERLSKNPGLEDPYFKELHAKLLALKMETSVIYLYTMAPVEATVFRYVVDGSSTPEDAEIFSPPGAEEDIKNYREPVLRALETKTIQTSSIDYDREWGWTISTYGPILNSAGKPVGIAACDFQADIASRFFPHILQELIVSAVFVLAGLVAYLYMMRGVNRQNQHLRELKEAAETARAAAEAISRDLKDERDTISAMKDALRVGLFFMDKNFVIQSNYSRALEAILDIDNLDGKKFTDLLSPQIKEQLLKNLIEYFVLIFNRAQAASHKLDGKMLESLNPVHEMVYVSPKDGAKRVLRCTFVPVDRGQGRLFILGNLQDITGEKRLEQELVEKDAKNRDPESGSP
ncbi:MAG: hypothetical protein LBE02_06685 [Spirochaetaceae bacterium]|jgi:PAS domain-containing protein|nr:hypothetical protein [Spirochaetaceae bacterium]